VVVGVSFLIGDRPGARKTSVIIKSSNYKCDLLTNVGGIVVAFCANGGGFRFHFRGAPSIILQVKNYER
jgi:hypothetical protein